MGQKAQQIAFGPVPSRRLGQSLGINNIPPKTCSYSCVYCQLGRTFKMQLKREAFYDPGEIFREVEQKVEQSREKREAIDYLTYVADGEPTLDLQLDKEIELLKGLDIPIAIITNASLLWRPEVREAVCQADWVSVKIDALTPEIWRMIDRPYGTLQLDTILQGITDLARVFNGELTTETMLVQGLNDVPEEVERIADFITTLHPAKSYLAIPTRPPAEKRVQAPTAEALNVAFQRFREKSLDVEYLLGYEGNAFAWTGNIEEDLLRITAVHPMRSDAVQALLTKAQASWKVVEKLLHEKQLREVQYQGERFYLRRFRT